MLDTAQANRRSFFAIIGAAVFAIALPPSQLLAGSADAGAGTATAVAKKRAAILSSFTEPKENTSQGLYIKILRDAGFDARAISAEEVRTTKLEGCDIFIVGGGSGTAFNKSLGAEGGEVVQEFIRHGGGALASCAGGYSFASGGNDALKYMTIAKANVMDFQDGR